jgi:hypothetical protein
MVQTKLGLEDKTLDQFNKEIYETFEVNSPNAFGKVAFPGLFYGNKLLVIAQNPGKPVQSGPKDDLILHTQKLDYETFKRMHEESYKRSILYHFLERFVNNEFHLDIKDISYTNIVKYSTINNSFPEEKEFEAFCSILTSQISLLKPEKIITWGKPVHEKLEKCKIPHVAYYHPAAFNYTKTEKIK